MKKSLQKTHSSSTVGSGKNVLLWFTGNDLRLHDNYALTLAARKCRETGGQLCPVFVFDSRTLSSASYVAGFFRAHPRRAIFLTECVNDLRNNFQQYHQVPMWLRVGNPEDEVPRLAQQLDCGAVFCHEMYSPHEAAVQNEVRRQLNEQSKSLLAVWGSTIIHIDDLDIAPEHLDFSFRHYDDLFSRTRIRPTEPYDGRREGLLPPADMTGDIATVEIGNLPTLSELGYRGAALEDKLRYGKCSDSREIMPFHGGESSAAEHLTNFFDNEGLLQMAPPGTAKPRPHMEGAYESSRISPYLATGCLSPRRTYELVRKAALDNSPVLDWSAQVMIRRLVKRDFWHYMGKKFGSRLYLPGGPSADYVLEPLPEQGWRHDRAIIRRFCEGVTGTPFVDACARELSKTGYLAEHGRQALIWYLVRGLHQDWRIAAEWFERNLLDYDPHLCWGNASYFSKLLFDIGGELVQSSEKLANMADAGGRYTKRWVTELYSVPITYLHRPQVMTLRMQAMHNAHIGLDYPHPVKLWVGAEKDPEVVGQLRSFVDRTRLAELEEGSTLGMGLIPGRHMVDKPLLAAPQTPTAPSDVDERMKADN